MSNSQTLQEFITKDKKFTKITTSSDTLSNSKSSRNCFIIYKKYGNQSIDFATNFVLEIELENSEYNFNTDNVFEYISLEISNTKIDKIYLNQIHILQKIYGLEVKKIDNKIFYPIPMECLINGNGLLVSKFYGDYCENVEIRIWIELINNNQENLNNIKSIKLNYDGIILDNGLDKLQNITTINLNYKPNITQYNLSSKELDLVTNKSNEKVMIINCNDKKQALTTKYIENYFTGSEKFNKSSKIKTNNVNRVERFIIYFEDSLNYNVCKEKVFDSIKFVANGKEIFDIDYYKLLSETNEKYPGLPIGVYVIDFFDYINYVPEREVFDFIGLKLPSDDIQVNIISQVVNFIGYDTIKKDHNNKWIDYDYPITELFFAN